MLDNLASDWSGMGHARTETSNTGSLSRLAACFAAFLFLMPYYQHAYFHTTLFACFEQAADLAFAGLCVSMGIVIVFLITNSWSISSKAGSPLFSSTLAMASFIAMLAMWFSADEQAILPGPAFSVVASCLYGIALVFAFVQMMLLTAEVANSDGMGRVIAAIALAATACVLVTLAPRSVYRAIAYVSLPLSCFLQMTLARMLGRTEVPSASDGAGSWPMRFDRFAYLMYFVVAVIGALNYLDTSGSEYLADTVFSIAITAALLLALAIGALVSQVTGADIGRFFLKFGIVIFVMLFGELMLMGFFTYDDGLSDFAAGLLFSLPRLISLFVIATILLPMIATRVDRITPICVYLLLMDVVPYSLRYLVLPMLLGQQAFDSHVWSRVLFVLSIVLLAALAALVVRELLRHDAPQVQQAVLGQNRHEVCEALASEYRLTERETEVLELVSAGYTAKKIADVLGIAPGTTNTHIKRVYAKIGVHSRQEVIDLVEWKGD